MSLLAPLAKKLNSALTIDGRAPSSADVIIILGAPCVDVNELNKLCKRRVEAAVDFWKAGKAPWLIPTGHRGEAVTMANYARELGVPKDSILVEPHAKTTKENAERSREIMVKAGLSKAIVVSNGYHVRRGLYWFRKVGIECVAGTPADDSVPFQPVAREFAAWGYTVLRSFANQ